MKWITLYDKIGKQPIRTTRNGDVYALLHNPKTHEMDKVKLILKFDSSGRPYFVQDFKPPKEPNRNRKKHNRKTSQGRNDVQ